MKLTVKKWIILSIQILTLAAGLTFLASCADDASLEERTHHAQVPEAITPAQPSDGGPFAAAMACADNLTNDGCDFTSGTGRDHPNQFLMVNLMNNCRTESLPVGCSWDGNITQTKIIEVDLSNCCYPASSLNFQMNSWKALAASVRPSGGYLITNYQRINGYMVTVYGPYRMVIQVTYRKKGSCPIIIREETSQPIDFTE